MPINDDNEQKDFDQNVLIIIKHCSFPQNISIFPSLQTNFFRKLLQYEDIPRFWLCRQNIFFCVCIFCCLNKKRLQIAFVSN